MSKSKSAKRDEDIKAIVRQQKSIIKNLRKQISRHEKRSHLHDDLEEKLAEEYLIEEKKELEFLSKEKCPECSEDLEIMDLKIKRIAICPSCKYRKVLKK